MIQELKLTVYLERSQRLPHVCTKMMYGKFGGKRNSSKNCWLPLLQWGQNSVHPLLAFTAPPHATQPLRVQSRALGALKWAPGANLSHQQCLATGSTGLAKPSDCYMTSPSLWGLMITTVLNHLRVVGPFRNHPAVHQSLGENMMYRWTYKNLVTRCHQSPALNYPLVN